MEPPRLAPGGSFVVGSAPRPRIGRLLLATLVCGLLYTALLPACLLLLVAMLSWQLLHWLMLSVLLVPVLLGLGLLALLKGALPGGLLVGAAAARWPGRIWPRLLAAAALTATQLFLLHRATLPSLVERGAWLVMDHRALLLVESVAPILAAMLAALLVPGRLARRIAGSGRA